jgi:hypothetical protein
MNIGTVNFQKMKTIQNNIGNLYWKNNITYIHITQ